MKHSEAKALIQKIERAAQKARSNILEVLDMDADPAILARVLEHIEPYLIGKMSIMPALEKVAYDDTLVPLDVYNICILAGKCPSLCMIYTWENLPNYAPLPEPDIQWLQGWEPEDD